LERLIARSRVSVSSNWGYSPFTGIFLRHNLSRFLPAKIISIRFCGAFFLGLPIQHHQKFKKSERVDSSPISTLRENAFQAYNGSYLQMNIKFSN
jgi:hypothetical protein